MDALREGRAQENLMPRRKPALYVLMLATALLVAGLGMPSLLAALNWMEGDAADAATRAWTGYLLLPGLALGLAVLVLALVSAVRQDLMTVGRVLLWGVLLALALVASGETTLRALLSFALFASAVILPGTWLASGVRKARQG